MNTEQYSNQVRLPFFYSFSAVTLAGNGSTSNTLTIAMDAHFEWWKTFINCSADADTDFNPSNVQIRLTDQSTGQLMASAELPQRIIAPWNGENRFPLPVIFAPGGTIVCDYTDLSASGNTVTVALFGYKLFR